MRRLGGRCAAILLGTCLTLPASAWSQGTCPGHEATVAAGWASYRAGAIMQADSLFRAALRACPTSDPARVGIGYVALREGWLDSASTYLEGVVARHPGDIDALIGLGLIAARRGDSAAAVRRFEAVRAIEPDNSTARDYLHRLVVVPPPPRPPLQLPDTVIMPARAHGDRFEILVDGAWRPFYINGINLGAALPGKFPSEFPDTAVYTKWIAQITEMGANTIRLYTINPPGLYDAIYSYNVAHPARPLWILHGVWAELPPEGDYLDSVWEGEFFAEMRRVVDLLHGRADLAPRPGHASGHYVADVSPWVLAYLIGREWEPYSVADFNTLRASDTTWSGRFVRVSGGTPMDAWLGRALDTLVAYETATYRAQRPVGYTNWPTLDPMRHPTESTAGEEVAIREAQGERLPRRVRELDNDSVGLDATRLHPTLAFPAGVFASFHAYPYYPDFMVLDPGYGRAASSEGPSNYFGYLKDLKAHHPGMPLIIAEYGVPASRGIAHLQPQGWHHGGHSEADMAAIDARLTREIAEAGLAGGILFAWMDEWFKKNWLVIDFELPAERNRLWLNRMDPEQMYGVYAMEPEPAVAGETAGDRARAWRDVQPLRVDAHGTLRAAADAAALWLRYEPVGPPPDELQIGFDMVDSTAGAFALAGDAAPHTSAGLEAVVVVRGDTARVVLDPAFQPFKVFRFRRQFTEEHLQRPTFLAPPPDTFVGRWALEYNRPVHPVPRAKGVYEPALVVTNRVRWGRDGTEYAGAGYDRGVLLPGEPPDGDWQRLPDGSVELRIPWLLLNVTDPSSRHVLFDPAGATESSDLSATQVQSIGIAVTFRYGERWSAGGSIVPVSRFTWPTWDAPRWRARRRPVFDSLQATWRDLERHLTREPH